MITHYEKEYVSDYKNPSELIQFIEAIRLEGKDVLEIYFSEKAYEDYEAQGVEFKNKIFTLARGLVFSFEGVRCVIEYDDIEDGQLGFKLQENYKHSALGLGRYENFAKQYEESDLTLLPNYLLLDWEQPFIQATAQFSIKLLPPKEISTDELLTSLRNLGITYKLEKEHFDKKENLHQLTFSFLKDFQSYVVDNTIKIEIKEDKKYRYILIEFIATITQLADESPNYSHKARITQFPDSELLSFRGIKSDIPILENTLVLEKNELTQFIFPETANTDTLSQKLHDIASDNDLEQPTKKLGFVSRWINERKIEKVLADEVELKAEELPFILLAYQNQSHNKYLLRSFKNPKNTYINLCLAIIDHEKYGLTYEVKSSHFWNAWTDKKFLTELT